GAGDVAAGSRLAAAGQDEILQRRQGFVVVVQPLFQARDVGVGDGGMAGDAQLAAQVEQLVLHRNQQVADVVGQLRGQQQANGRIGLVDGAIGADAVGVLGDPAAVAQPGGSVVAGAGIDL